LAACSHPATYSSLDAINKRTNKLDCTHGAQTFAKTSNLNKKVIVWDMNQDFQINLDSEPNVSQLAPKMLWIHYLVGISHFTECRENWPVTVREMIINLKRSPFPEWQGK